MVKRARRLELEGALVRLDGAGESSSMSRRASPTRRHVARAGLVVGDQLGLLDEDAHERRPVAEQRRQGVHLLERLELGLVEREEAVPGVERAARVVAPLVVELRQRRQELALRQPVGLRRSPSRRRRGELVPALAWPRPAGRARPRASPSSGSSDPRLPHGVEGALRVAAALLPEPRGLAEDRDPLAVVGRRARAARSLTATRCRQSSARS